MRIVITGGSGRLGRQLSRVFPEALFPGHAEMDITDRDMVFRYMEEKKPDIVIHTAAMTDVRRCDQDWQDAERVNITGTYYIAESCRHLDGKLVFISTACIFDGENAPFSEGSRPGPKNFYSITKYAAEHIVRHLVSDFLIIRTNFAPRERWPFPAAFTDRYGTYLFADDLAAAIRDVVQRGLTGIVHVCGDQRMSMFDLARITTPGVLPMDMGDYQGPPLTRDMSLVSTRIKPYTMKKDMQ